MGIIYSICSEFKCLQTQEYDKETVRKIQLRKRIKKMAMEKRPKSYVVQYSLMSGYRNLPALITDYSIPGDLPPAEVQKIKNQIRFWERDYEKWAMEGWPKPDAHPVKTHKWNTNPEFFDDIVEENEDK